MLTASAYAREMLAITDSVKKWCHYLICHKFKITRIKKSLKHLLSQVFQMPEQHQLTLKLQGFDYELIYCPGQENWVVYSLSRCQTKEELPVESMLLLSISLVVPSLLNQLRQYCSAKEEGKTYIVLYSTNPIFTSKFEFWNGLIMFKERIFILHAYEWRQTILT